MHWILFSARLFGKKIRKTANNVLPEHHIISVVVERFRCQEVMILPSFTSMNRVRNPQHVVQSLVKCAARDW